MSDMERFQRWARRAREEGAPGPDVVPAVMARLRRMPALDAPPPPRTLLWALSGAAGCVATVCAALGYQAWLAASDRRVNPRIQVRVGGLVDTDACDLNRFHDQPLPGPATSLQRSAARRNALLVGIPYRQGCAAASRP